MENDPVAALDAFRSSLLADQRKFAIWSDDASYGAYLAARAIELVASDILASLQRNEVQVAPLAERLEAGIEIAEMRAQRPVTKSEERKFGRTPAQRMAEIQALHAYHVSLRRPVE